MTVYADRDLYKDVWWEYRKWMQKYRDVPGFYGLHCNMPITPRAIEQGVLNGGNALGLEGTTHQTLGGNPFWHSFFHLTNPTVIISRKCDRLLSHDFSNYSTIFWRHSHIRGRRAACL